MMSFINLHCQSGSELRHVGQTVKVLIEGGAQDSGLGSVAGTLQGADRVGAVVRGIQK